MPVTRSGGAIGRLGDLGQVFVRRGHALFQLGAVHRDKGRAEAVSAGKVLVAAGLVDASFSAELGFERLDGDAVGLDAAIAAALADERVDDDALVGVGARPRLRRRRFSAAQVWS
jgi:hypothetical protein